MPTTHLVRGDANITRDLYTITPVAANNATYTITINTKTITYTADASATVAEITAGLVALAQATVEEEFAEFTWTDGTTVITATGATDGSGTAAARITSSSSAGSLTTVHTTAPTGANHWLAGNFSSGSLPANGDSVYAQSISVDILYDIDQNAVALAVLEWRRDCTGKLGLPVIDANGNYESRPLDLKIQTAILRIGDGLGQGSGRLNFDVGTGTACAAVIYNTGTPADQDEGAVHLIGANAGNTLDVFAGKVDLAMRPNTTATWPAIVVAGGTLRCGSGCTNTAVTVQGSGACETRSAMTTAIVRDKAKLTHFEGNITTLTNEGGTTNIRNTAALTIGTLTLYADTILDLTLSEAAVTVTNATLYAGAKIVDPGRRLVMTNAATCPNGPGNVTIDRGGASGTLKVT